ncbi:MAG TPA: MotA/TolQ/ExbB proton channel family protein [Pirellulaceae bacterium]|nr:MotA/TolQ/ExbB proton channel family protein [Pirellulaceae bacterium]
MVSHPVRIAVLLFVAALCHAPVAAAQESGGPSAAEPGSLPAAASDAESEAPTTPPDQAINVWQLARDGGMFMYPIYALSLVAVAVIVERFIALRRQRVLPSGLITALGQIGGAQGGFDPRKAYRVCQQYPSTAANIIRAMLLKVGRPLAEIETTVHQASQREADRLHGNIRWLNLSSALAPLLGLLGTMQGMILAFHLTTVLPPGANKSVELAGGIYTALVTTFAGLCVAIPATAFAHYFEGRITILFHQIDELVFSLLPQLERYEGRVRFNRQGTDELPAEEKAPVAAP